MADDTKAPHLTLVQPAPQRRPKTPAERAKAYRDRKKGKDQSPAPVADIADTPQTVRAIPQTVPAIPQAPTGSHRLPAATILLTIAALALGAVGITMNGWFARSLGSSETAGWLFLAIGVAADLVALAMPSCSAMAWQARQRATALAGWAIWTMTFAFAVTAGLGFAAVNISDVTSSRASRVTPAVTAAQAALSDAMASRDRECNGGVGKVCRQREETVTERRQALDAAMRAVEQTADPQTEAAIRVVAWASFGTLKPAGDDFAMVRLLLLALLPQVGGLLLMIGRVR
jgi:hypothetical protein